MPPVGFWAEVTSSYDSASGALTFLTPSAVRANDVLLAALVVANTAGAPTPPDGWSLLSTLAGGAGVAFTTYLYRRIASDEEPAQHVFGCGIATSPDPLGVFLLYRGLDAGAAVVDAQIATTNPGSANHAAASVTLVHYSDLVLLVYFDTTSPSSTMTPAAGTTQRAYLAGGDGNGAAIMVADVLPQAVGATGTKTAVASTAGLATGAAFALQAVPTLSAPSVVPDIQGAIGFVTVGV